MEFENNVNQNAFLKKIKLKVSLHAIFARRQPCAKPVENVQISSEASLTGPCESSVGAYAVDACDHQFTTVCCSLLIFIPGAF
jgi:hypothetical protein